MLQGWISFVLLSAAVLPNVAAASASKLDRDYRIRVKLGEFENFSVNGYDLKINQRARLEDHRKIDVECRDSGRREEVLLGAIGVFPSPLSLQAGGGYIFVNGSPYRDTVLIFHDKGKCLVVNELGMERYIAGVINNEMQASWPLEALKAQAVAARSYAISIVQQASPQTRFHVEMDTRDQMYRGVASESLRANLATSSTRGNVLIFDRQVLRSFYHASCGGKTDLPNSVWSDQPQAAYRSVYCPYHVDRPAKKQWTWRIERPQLDSALRRVAGVLPRGFASLASLRQGTLSPGNRHKTLIATDELGQSVEIPANLLRQSLGFNNLRSTRFELRSHSNAMEFRGVGHGHGVGMCQIGAREMSLQGKSHLQILRFYYPLAQIANLY